MTCRTKFWLLPLLTIVLAGCGSDKAGSGSSNTVPASNGCITGGCHEIKTSAVTGNAIGAEWAASSHKSMNIAGCTTCHGHYHSNSCGGCHGGAPMQAPQQNSLDAGGRCFDCHVSGPDLMNSLDDRHLPELNPKYRPRSGFNYYSAVGYVTMRGTEYESKCIWCHNPHDSRVLPQHGQWAESGHGETGSGAFASSTRDFKTLGSMVRWDQAYNDVCARCHTASGYINLVTSNMTDVRPWGLGVDGVTPIAPTKQNIYCNVCHDNGSGKAYGYALRPIPHLGAQGGIRVYNSYSAAGANVPNAARMRLLNYVDYPAAGISDRCILCHSGLGNGDLIKKAAGKTGINGVLFDYSTAKAVSMHYFGGGATMFGVAGFEWSGLSYENSLANSHNRIGAGFPGTGSRGPCVSCHMSSAESHGFMPVSFTTAGSIASINTALCSTCHRSGQPAYMNFSGTPTDLTAKKNGYKAVLKALDLWLKKKKLDSPRATPTYNWVNNSTYLAPPDYAFPSACSQAGTAHDYYGSRNMGAYFNYGFAANDPGAYVHNDLYTKRLIFDSLDWIDDCAMNKSVFSAVSSARTSWIGTRMTDGEAATALKYFGVPRGARPGD